MKSQLIWKNLGTWNDWSREEETTVDEIAGWHHQLNGHEFKYASGIGDGRGSLAYCSPWGRKESDMTEQLNWTDCLLSRPFNTRQQYHRKIWGDVCCCFIFSHPPQHLEQFTHIWGTAFLTISQVLHRGTVFISYQGAQLLVCYQFFLLSVSGFYFLCPFF